MINQETMVLISERRQTLTHNKDMSGPRLFSPGVRVNTRYINSIRGTSSTGDYINPNPYSLVLILFYFFIASIPVGQTMMFSELLKMKRDPSASFVMTYIFLIGHAASDIFQNNNNGNL